MAKVPASLFPPLSLDEVISHLASFSEAAYQVLRNEIESDLAFDVGKDRCERLAPILQIPAQNVALLLRALAIVYERTRSLPGGTSGVDAIQAFVAGLSEVELGEEAKKTLVRRLSELTAPNEKIELAKKIRRLRAGFLPNATSFASFVDLRPDFLPGYDSIRGYTVMIQFQITTDSDNPSQKQLVFQVDEKALTQLKQAIVFAESKVKTLRHVENLGPSIYPDPGQQK